MWSGFFFRLNLNRRNINGKSRMRGSKSLADDAAPVDAFVGMNPGWIYKVKLFKRKSKPPVKKNK